MNLWLGGTSNLPSPFASDDERRAFWFRHRDYLTLRLAGHGRRPMAWWAYEAGDLRYPGYDTERSVLFEANLLPELERTELLTYWRQEFDRANAPDFWLSLGPERSLKGAPARRHHYKWADIPRPLVEAWSAERRRSAERIRKLQAEASGACRESGSEPGA